MATVGTDAKARAIEEITAWCEDKGTIVFLLHLLKLLDTETHGDSRYFGEGLHEAIKALWPYEPAPVETKKGSAVGKRQSPVQPSFSCPVSEFSLPWQDSEVFTCRVETSTSLSITSRPAGQLDTRKRRRLPSWIGRRVEPSSSDTTSDVSGSDNGSTE
ncbi:hypothetical protein R1sor_002119 [Riccia sorocarpa]|uniref:Uncharacterized protein n=1 Tax=Riccia sorocarpa TaxID=122646 RepID=A0ABD3H106_9MARC